MAEIVYLGLGSNLGDRIANLGQAVKRLGFVVKLLDRSPNFQTKPWGYQDQPYFINQAVLGETALSPHTLLSELKRIELDLGREPTFQYGPRLIDIDILFYGYQIINEKDLVIPHPHLHERAFVLAPLAEIAADFRHPILGLTVKEMLLRVDRQGVALFDPGKTGSSIDEPAH